ncbi:Stk1 family PASTA domain-containing Ser/Thr kinase [Halanaerobiaceae bacterium Z-7014]|uniref:non-specific serine/threonine protein kinase n=1 Tax=Halonatronomonas betaini TaxID=2778430 RepID=A0A931AXU7_9FIRM|nr:Stk1 family PASTA domain-containing Ser/Thr kinase [Halonatronomonas betaini]MBF8436808.1 Stk1 family PASTA domain-containing Ser/Thr kinase [Halonatronomonas betaini]
MDKVIKNRYEINKELGRGGMAVVYEATDIMLDRQVALKMLRPEYASDEEFIKKIRHEARAVARISHPNVVNIYDIGQTENYHYLIMENIIGQNLKDIIEARGKLPIIEALDISSQIAAALNVAHESDIVHCDIKPHNIILTPENQVKVTDFGIARAVSSTVTLDMTDSVVGSAHYFSPEQAKGGEITPLTDIYSLGVVLFEMLTGTVPFKGETAVSVALKHIKEPVPDLSDYNNSIPEEVNQLIKKALAKDPDDRFSSALEMREELLQAMAKINRLRRENKNQKRRDIFERTKIHNYKEINELDNNSTDKKVSSLKTNKRSKREKSNKSKKSSSKIKRPIIYALIGIGILTLLIGGFIFAYNRVMNVPIAEVPDVTGIELEEATEIIEESGFEYTIAEEERFSSEIDEGNIYSQEPAAGENIRVTRSINLILSAGPERREIPDLSGMTTRQATIELERLGFVVGETDYEFSDEIEQNRVINTDPEIGEEYLLGDEVNLVVSQGNVVQGHLDENEVDDDRIKNRTISFTGSGNEVASYRLMIEDDTGIYMAWRAQVEPGEQVEIEVESYGSTRYLLYREDDLIYDELLE